VQRQRLNENGLNACSARNLLAHTPPEPDANNIVRQLRRGKGGWAVARAVHAVLQVVDLPTLAQLDGLCAAAARDEGIPDQVALVRRYVRNASASQPVQDALSGGRYWREVPIAVAQDDCAIVEGAIDLLHELRPLPTLPRLRVDRIARALAQAELAERSRVSRVAITCLERGVVDARFEDPS
jgi:hypothetical protein